MSKKEVKDITYYQYCGEVNTTDVLKKAKQRSEALGINTIIIASETGKSAIEALNVFDPTAKDLIVVTHYPATTTGPKGKIPIGLGREAYADRREELEQHGVEIVQGTRPVAPPTRCIDWNAPIPSAMLDKTLELFGAGTKIAVEVALMATDGGVVEAEEEIIACAGTYKGLDTALVVRSAYSMNFFSDFKIREIICMPRYRLKKTAEGEYKNWKGNLEQYYDDIHQ